MRVIPNNPSREWFGVLLLTLIISAILGVILGHLPVSYYFAATGISCLLGGVFAGMWFRYNEDEALKHAAFFIVMAICLSLGRNFGLF